MLLRNRRRDRARYPVSAGGGALISAISSDGWTGTWASGTPPTFAPDTSPQTFTLTRPGFTATAGSGNLVTTTNYVENVTFTSRVRQPAPGDGTLTPSSVAHSDFTYAGDTSPGVTNSSTEVSPKPIAHWCHGPRRLVDSAVNQLPVAIRAEHRDGIVAVVFSVTDGTTTLTQTVITPVVANRTGDMGAVIEYQHTFDTTTLNAGQLTIRGIVYARLGSGTNGVLDSADQTIETRSFCNQLATKGPKYFIYVDAAGVDATAACSTTAATAEAAPALTIKGAIERARVLMPGNRVGGLEIRLNAGTWTTAAVAFNTYQDATSAEVILTRNPNVARANVTLTYTASVNYYLPYLRFADIKIVRGGNVGIGANITNITFRDVDADLGGFTSVITAFVHFWEGGSTFTNAGAGAINNTVNCYMMRGVNFSNGATTVTASVWNTAGCRFENVIATPPASANEDNTFVEGCTFPKVLASGGTGGLGLARVAGVTSVGIAVRNIVLEYSGLVANNGFTVSPDGTGSSTTHVVLRGITAIGQYSAGRFNGGYDESAGVVRRTHKLWRVEGCMFGQFNNKSDRFVWYNQGNADSVNRTGAWPVMYGVGWEQNVYIYPDASNGLDNAFRQDYPGLGAKIATVNTAPLGVVYNNYQGTTFTAPSTYTAGAGNGGPYTMTTNPYPGLVVGSRLIADIAGTARNQSADTAGAYV